MTRAVYDDSRLPKFNIPESNRVIRLAKKISNYKNNTVNNNNL